MELFPSYSLLQVQYTVYQHYQLVINSHCDCAIEFWEMVAKLESQLQNKSANQNYD